METGIISLRPIKETDLELIMEWRMKPEVTDYLYTDPKLTMDTQKKWYNGIMTDDTTRYWIIEFNEIRIGIVWLLNIDFRNQKVEFGWFNGELSYRGGDF